MTTVARAPLSLCALVLSTLHHVYTNQDLHTNPHCIRCPLQPSQRLPLRAWYSKGSTTCILCPVRDPVLCFRMHTYVFLYLHLYPGEYYLVFSFRLTFCWTLYEVTRHDETSTLAYTTYRRVPSAKEEPELWTKAPGGILMAVCESSGPLCTGAY